MTQTGSRVAIIGAGPYGLATAAHLRKAGVETATFGRAMDFWKNHMPAGMLLRSPWDASHIADPDSQFTLDRYHSRQKLTPIAPVPLDTFVDYGKWFQRENAPNLDTRQIVQIEKDNGGFRLHLEDGDTFHARRVIIATGISSFANRPPVFDDVPAELASHSNEHRDFKRFAGKSVIVVGRGQSALESAALLHENGAEVEVVVRTPLLRWLHSRKYLRHGWLRSLFFHPTDVGPPLLTHISARPHLFRLLPLSLQPKFTHRCIRPAGAAWLKSRVDGVRITTGRNIVSAVPQQDQLFVRLDDGSGRLIDHVILATGYQIDIRRHAFLPPSLLDTINCVNGYPQLKTGFESSVPGLHFVGAPAAYSFGPLMRFVSGTGYTADRLSRFIRRSEVERADSSTGAKVLKQAS